MSETWRIIPSNRNYAVSSHGRVKRLTTYRAHKAGYILSQYHHPKVYPAVVLSDKNVRRRVFVHVLVAEAFLGPRPEGLQINHKDGDKRNSHASNIEYVTPSENMRHALRNGLRVPPQGEQCAHAKLTVTQVVEIRELAATLTYPEIARRFGIDRARVSRICRGELWPSAPGPIWARRRHGNNQHRMEHKK